MAQYTLVDSQNGSTLHLRLGDVVVLRLEENPASGYRWEIADAEGFLLEADDFTHAPVGISGDGGERALRFRATARGARRIETVLRRDRESTPAPRSFSATVEIR